MAKFNPNPWKQKKLAEALRDPELSKKQAEEMADIEFQMEIAPHMNYEGDIDPSVARWHPLKGKKWDKYSRLDLEGFQVPEDQPEGAKLRPYTYEYRDDEGTRRHVEIPKEIGTVNTIDYAAGDPQVWAHEYRHRERPEMSEARIRIWDIQNAQNEEQFKRAAEMLRQSMAYGGGWLMSKGERKKYAEMNQQQAMAEAIRRAKDHEKFYRQRYNDKGEEEYFTGWDDTPYYERRK